MSDLRMFLGTPYERGQSENIVSRQAPDTVGEGLAVKLTGDNTVDLVTTGSIPYGVTGKREIGAIDVVQAGLKVFIRTALTVGDTDVVVGSGASIDLATGMFVKTGGTAVNAIIRSGVVECKDSRGNSFNGVALDFAGGL